MHPFICYPEHFTQGKLRFLKTMPGRVLPWTCYDFTALSCASSVILGCLLNPISSGNGNNDNSAYMKRLRLRLNGIMHLKF